MYQLDSRKYWLDPYIPIQFEFRNPQSPFPLHIHDFYEMVLVYSGKATHLTVYLKSTMGSLPGNIGINILRKIYYRS